MRYYLFTTLSLIMFFLAISAIITIQINPQKNILLQIFLFFGLMALAILFFKVKVYSFKEIISKIKEELQADYL